MISKTKTLQNKNLQQMQNKNVLQDQHKFLIIQKLKQLSHSTLLLNNNLSKDTLLTCYEVRSKNLLTPYLLPSKKEPYEVRRNLNIQSKSPKTLPEFCLEKVKQGNNVIYQLNQENFTSLKIKNNSKNHQLTRRLTHSKWLNYFFYNNPINLLFSIDEFLFEFAKKQPRRRKSSEFQQQLKQRKKLTIFYGYLSKKQLQNLLFQSKSYQGYFSKNFFSILERRLDVLLYRSGLVKNIITARQLISHKKIMVNHQIQNIASYQVNPGDIIAIISKNNEIVSPLLETIRANFKKRRSRFTISQNFIYKLQNRTNLKNYKQKKTIKNYIRLLLTKVEKRAHLKINTSSFPGGNFTLLKLKPLISKTAKSFLLICIQKNYLSLDRKPIFQNKYTRFVNLLERYVFLDLPNKSRKIHKDIHRKNIQKDKNPLNYEKKNTKKWDILHVKHVETRSQKRSYSQKQSYSQKHSLSQKLSFCEREREYATQNKKLLHTMKSFTRKLSNFTSIKKNSIVKNSSIYSKKRALTIYRNIVYKTLLQMYSHFFYSPFFDIVNRSISYGGFSVFSSSFGCFCLQKESKQMENKLNTNTFQLQAFPFGTNAVAFAQANGKRTVTRNQTLAKSEIVQFQINGVNLEKHFATHKKQIALYQKQSNNKKNITNTLLTLKLKKHITKKRSRKQILKALRVCVIKPMHIEVSFSISTAILLYSPQRLSFPFFMDVDLILRSFR